MPFDPTVTFSPSPEPVRISSELLAYYRAKAQDERRKAFAAYARSARRALKRFGCWFRRPSVAAALRGGCD